MTDAPSSVVLDARTGCVGAVRRGGGGIGVQAQVAEIGHDLGDLGLGRHEALPAEAQQLGGAVHVRGQRVDVHVGCLEGVEDLLQFGQGGGIAVDGSQLRRALNHGRSWSSRRA